MVLTSRTRDQRSVFAQRYQRWCADCRAALPDDLRVQFDDEVVHAVSLPDPNDQHWWNIAQGLAYDIPKQREIVFIARRRLWSYESATPKPVRTAIADICRQSFKLPTIRQLFIDSGSEHTWYVPPFEPTESERQREALGRIDGILVHVPDRELPIVRAVCERLYTSQHLSPEQRDRINQARALLEPPSPADLFARAPLHSTVQAIAAPLLAVNLDDEALFKVCAALSSEVQHRTGRIGIDNTKLMLETFSKDKPLLRCSPDPTEQQGWMHLFSAAFMTIRNPIAHGKPFSTSRAHTLEWLTFLSALFHTLDRIP